MKWARCVLIFLFVPILLFGNGLIFAQTRQPITLEECLKAALSHHPSVQAFEKAEKEKHLKKQQLTAETRPQLAYTFTAGTFRYSPYHYRSFQNGIELTWNVGKWVGHLPQLGTTEENKARFQFLQNQLKLAFEVKQAFFQLVQARKAVQVARLSQRYLQRHLNISQKLFRIGQISQLDLFRSQTSLLEAQQEVAAAENRRQQWHIQLQNLTGKRFSRKDSLVFPSKMGNLSELSPDSLLHLAQKYHPALRIFDQEIRQALLREKLTTASRLPTVYFSGGFVLDNDPTSGGNYAVMEGGLQVPLVDWQQRQKRAQEFRLHAETLQEMQKALSLEIRTHIEKVLRQIQYLQTTKSLKAATLARAKQAYLLTEKTYQAGTASNTDVLLVQKEWARAKLSWQTVQLQLRLAQAELDFWIGKTGVAR